MTKLREIVDKLGLPINQEFMLDVSTKSFGSSLILKINEEGEVLFYHEENEKWLISAWSLVDVYVKGYVLVDEYKEEYMRDNLFYALISEILTDYLKRINFLIDNSKDSINVFYAKEDKYKAEKVLKELERRLLNQ